MATNAASLTKRLIVLAVALLPLACWPAAPHPFSTPKLWLVAALDLLVAFEYLTASRRVGLPSWPWLVWITAVLLSAVTAPLLSPSALLLLVLPLPLAMIAAEPRALCVGSAVESAVVLLQFANRDPFSWFGWRPEAFASSRMRVYGTFGNPDFVAAWLAATLPLCLLVRGRALRSGLVVLQIAALLCTGSRVILVAVPAALVALAIAALGRASSAPTNDRGDGGGRASSATTDWCPPPRWSWLLAALLVCAALWLSPARSLGATVSGRLHYVRVTAAHLHEVPVTGFGAGAFEVKFAAWQDAWVRQHPADARYRGPVDHAHNDYLEFWVDYGPPGAVAFLLLCAWLLWHGVVGRGAPPAVAALTALLAIACVDFPFHRPAGWALFALLAGMARSQAGAVPAKRVRGS